MDIKSLLKQVVAENSTDLIIVADAPPMFRISGELVPASKEVLTAEASRELIYNLLAPSQKERFEREKELDVSYELPGIARFRVNVHYQKGSVAAALRPISEKIPSLEELNLPKAIAELANEPRGLVLVTGPTGCGKTTTQACMIDIINSNRHAHIITIEDPIEYLHHNRKSIVEQREVGIDTASFATALREALRQNPNVILVGEMRDLETISTAVTAAETGHLVISTLHTNDSVQAVDRIVDAFPPHSQQQIRLQLSLTLQVVIAQQLLPKRDGKGLIPAVEILRATPAIRNIIRKAATADIYSMMEIGAKYGMQTMDGALKDLCQKGLLTKEEALSRAINQENLSRLLG